MNTSISGNSHMTTRSSFSRHAHPTERTETFAFWRWGIQRGQTRLATRLTWRQFRAESMRISHFALTGMAERRMKSSAVLSRKDVARKAGCRNSRPGAKKSRYRSSNRPPRKQMNSGGKGGRGYSRLGVTQSSLIARVSAAADLTRSGESSRAASLRMAQNSRPRSCR